MYIFPMPNIKIMFQILLFVCLLTAGNVLWKYGLIQINGFMTNGKMWAKSLWELATCPFMWIGAFFYIIGTLYWFTILSRNNLSYVYPMVSIGYIFTSMMGVILFGETISMTGWIGMGIVLIGFVVLSYR